MKDGYESLPVTVDKSHLITIGERLYSQSIELIRELVNNAYDADATRVEVTVTDELIEIKDNGTGMDLEGLKQYFNVGSEEKLMKPKSPVFQRDRVGQFGIGKFASLSACNRFEVYTQRGDFAAQVVFDKKLWEQEGNTWEIPLKKIVPDGKRGDGTTVRLTELTKSFDPAEVERKIIEGVPLKAKDFKLRLNGYPISPRSVTGHRIPFVEGTDFGVVHGEIVILPASGASTEEMGIEVRVKQVMIRRELFGMESWGKAVTRIRGEVNADFLLVTSDRTGFVQDSPEYQAFLKVMTKVMGEVKKVMATLSSKQDNRRVSRALKEAMNRVHHALALNPDFSPFGVIPFGEEVNKGIGETGVTPEKKKETDEGEDITPEEEASPGEELPEEEKEGEGESGETVKRERAPSLKVASTNAVVKRLKFGERGVTCCLDHFGEDGPECFTEGTVVYINRDHPLYKRESKKKDTHILNITRLLTQEISLMKDPKNPREAYNRQSHLLRDAFRDTE
jgi:hypothetical protein